MVTLVFISITMSVILGLITILLVLLVILQGIRRDVRIAAPLSYPTREDVKAFLSREESLGFIHPDQTDWSKVPSEAEDDYEQWKRENNLTDDDDDDEEVDKRG